EGELTLDAPIVNDAFENDTEITGTGETGSTVQVTDNEGNEIGTAVIDGDGNFNVILDRPLVEGDLLEVIQFIEGENGELIKSDPTIVTVLPVDGEEEETDDGSNGNDSGGTVDDDANGSGTNDGDGKELPKTATSTFNWILGGFMTLLAGVTGLFSRRKKISKLK